MIADSTLTLRMYIWKVCVGIPLQNYIPLDDRMDIDMVIVDPVYGLSWVYVLQNMSHLPQWRNGHWVNRNDGYK